MTQRRHEAPELGAAARRFLRALAVRATEGDTEAIEQLAQLCDDAETALGQAIAGAREAKAYSWADIAGLIGTSRQNAQQRYGKSEAPVVHKCDTCAQLFPTTVGLQTHQVRAHGAERCPKVTHPKPQRCAMPADHAPERHVMAADDPTPVDELADDLVVQVRTSPEMRAIVRAAARLCWCGADATARVPVDPEVTTPSAVMSDGQPGLLVCDDHMDRDGYERVTA